MLLIAHVFGEPPGLGNEPTIRELPAVFKVQFGAALKFSVKITVCACKSVHSKYKIKKFMAIVVLVIMVNPLNKYV
jgi:hypothetical protein